MTPPSIRTGQLRRKRRARRKKESQLQGRTAAAELCIATHVRHNLKAAWHYAPTGGAARGGKLLSCASIRLARLLRQTVRGL